MTQIVVHTLQWREDQAVRDDDELAPNANLLTLVEIDGVALEPAVEAKVEISNGFTNVWVKLAGEVTVESHTIDEWERRGYDHPWARAFPGATLAALYAQAERTPADTGTDTTSFAGNDSAAFLAGLGDDDAPRGS